MRIWPAIDLKNGNCVRLSQGDYHRETVYGSDPADMAARWVAEGASGLHVIDLDGALGKPANRQAISEIADAVDVEIQVGGGINSQQIIEDYLSLGIKRLVVATKSFRDPDWITSMAERYEGYLVVSIDTRNNGKIAYDGWQKTSEFEAMDHAQAMSRLPIAGLIFTDIDRAGMMSGPNLELLEILNGLNVPLINSGGVRNLDDIRQLSESKVQGCVIGRALYDGKISLPAAIATATANV